MSSQNRRRFRPPHTRALAYTHTHTHAVAYACACAALLWTGMASGQPAQAPAPSAAPEPKPFVPKPFVPKTDRQRLIGSLGIGFDGVWSVQLPRASATGRADQPGLNPNDHIEVRSIQVPTLGARRWLSKRFGIDAVLGLWFSGGSTDAKLGSTSVSVPKESIFSLVTGLAMPIAVLDTEHASFLLKPEVVIGWARSNIAALYEENAPPDLELRGGFVSAGLEAGAELYFGFIGLPRLALECGVGINARFDWASAAVGNQSVQSTTFSLFPWASASPWAIFSSNASLAARYYF